MEQTSASEPKIQYVKIILNRQQVFWIGGVTGLIIGVLGMFLLGK